jgi:benzoyl-CoA reductase subunit D
MIVAGIDCGAKSTKTVILREGRIIGRGRVPTGFDQAAAVRGSLEAALRDAGLDEKDVERIGGTGAGQGEITMAAVKVSEIRAIGLAAARLFPSARTVTDVGAERARAARITARGRVEDFAINEKCAAGTGAFLEAMARALEVRLDEMGPLSMKSNRTIPMNSQCAIFAESEVVGLIHAKTPKEDISRAIHDAMAGRIASMIRRIGVNEDIAMMGGVGLNPGFVHALTKELGIAKVLVPDDPALGAALGAALAAGEE